jgi:hypothetical protein
MRVEKDPDVGKEGGGDRLVVHAQRLKGFSSAGSGLGGREAVEGTPCPAS